MTTQSNLSTPRTVLVLGAAGGMCGGINDVLAARGHTLLCADLPKSRLREEVERLRSAGVRAEEIFLDAREVSDIERVCDELDDRGLQPDVLINAAGVLDRKALFDHDGSSFANTLAVNLVGPFNLIRRVAPGMIEKGWGRIVNISSIAANRGYPFPSYAASKAGLANLTRSLVGEFWGTGVTVNNIAPGIVDTPMAEPSLIEEASWRVPSGRAVEPAEIGELVAYLVSDAARNINGADIVIDGGITSYFQVRSRHEFH